MKKIIASPHAPKAVGPYSQAVEAGGALYVSGQLPIDGATQKMAEGIEAQTRQSLTNLRISSKRPAIRSATWPRRPSCCRTSATLPR